ncbi:MAG: hypothetical protein ACRC3J_09130 [Culicoidibacterales bacterium]
MLLYERQIARQLAFVQRNFRDMTRSNGETRLNFSCPICGDSKKDEYAARAWFNEKEGSVWYGCYNCGWNKPLSVYLKMFVPDEYRNYIKEKFKNTDRPKRVTTLAVKEEKQIKAVHEIPYSVQCSTLPENHPIVKYMLKRCIPRHRHDLFYFTQEWRKLANYVCDETYTKENASIKENRLVIPIYNKDMSIACVQGRALSDDGIRYMTIKADQEASKVYGMERVAGKGDVFIFEGPIDSTFVKNGIAIVGGTMALEEAPYPGRRVWVLDNENRAYHTLKRIENLIAAGERVVLFDKIPWKSKDINDFISKENATEQQIQDYLESNIIKGLSAKHRFAQYSKFKK